MINSFLQCRSQWRPFHCSYCIYAMSTSLWEAKEVSFVILSFCFMRLYSFLGLGSPAEHLVFVQDETEDSGNDFVCHDSTDSSTPWFLRVQELAHDSLIAATRAQLAKNAKASNNGRKFRFSLKSWMFHTRPLVSACFFLSFILSCF